MGSHIVTAMQKQGKHKITAITRPDSTSAMPAGITVKKVNYDDAAELKSAMEGQDILIITLSVFTPPTEQFKLVEAAAAANVPYVMPNVWGSDCRNEQLLKDTMTADRIYPVLRKIEELGKSAWIGCICSFWYEWSLTGGTAGVGPYMYGFDLKNRSINFYDDGETKIDTSTWPQTGLAVARLLALKEKPDGPGDKEPTLSQFKNDYFFVSSFCINQKDMLQSVCRVTGTKESDWKKEYTPSKEQYEKGQEQLKKGDFNGFPRQLYSRMFFQNGDGLLEKKYGLQNEMLGLPKEDLDEATRAAFIYGQVAI